MPTKIFKSKAALRRNAAYVHIHDIPHRHIVKEVKEPSGKIKITTDRKVWYNEAHQGLIALAVIAVAGLIGFHLYQRQKSVSSSQSSQSPAVSSFFGSLDPYETLPEQSTQSSTSSPITSSTIISTPTYSSPIVSSNTSTSTTTTSTSTSSGSSNVSTLPQQEPQGFEQGFAQHNMNIKQAQTSTTTNQTSSPVIVAQTSTTSFGPILASQISRILNFRR